MKRVLITGASGLLGTAVVEHFRNNSTPVLALAHNNAFPGMRVIDLLDIQAVAGLESEDWDAVVNCAAYRSPDFCEDARDKTLQLNGKMPGVLAAIAAKRSARMVHISTDYVFDGTNPPYSEGDETNPVNYYGEAKLAGERAVMEAYPSAVVLRVPALYGEPPAPVESSMIEEGITAATSGEPSSHDDKIVRFPTYTGDVAAVISFLLNSDFTGIVHASGGESVTRYEWALAIAGMLGTDTSFISIMATAPQRKATRPLNSQLDTAKLEDLGAPRPRGYTEVVLGLLSRRSADES